MKSIYIPIFNTTGLVPNGFDACRTEGRFMINTGVGLSTLGFNVVFENDDWLPVRSGRKRTTVINKSIRELILDNKGYFDYAMIFSNYDVCDGVKADKYVLVLYAKDILYGRLESYVKRNRIDKEKVVVAVQYRESLPIVRERLKDYEVQYLPPLFPMYTYRTSFQKYRNKVVGDTIKIYSQMFVHYDNADYGSAVEVVKQIEDTIKSLGYKVKFYFQSSNSEILRRSFENAVILNQYIPYNKMCNAIVNTDMGIAIFGEGAKADSAMFDFISLGSPLISLFVNPEQNTVNPLSQNKWLAFNLKNYQYREGDLIAYVERVTNNRAEIVEGQQEVISELNYPEWANAVCKTKIFDLRG